MSGGGGYETDANGNYIPDPVAPTTTDPDAAYVWYNSDYPIDGIVDPITFVDSLDNSIWECETVMYRVEQLLCVTDPSGPETFYTPAESVSVLGSQEDPWLTDDSQQENIVVTEGRYPFKVRIEWDNALGAENLVDQFRLYRRLYTPAQPDPEAWEQIFSSEDITWFIDQDLAAGTLYEYRVGAVLDCGGDAGAEEFFSPAPYQIGFRSAIGGVTGEIRYESNPEVGVPLVLVELEPQGTNNARQSLAFDHNEYVTFHYSDFQESDGTVSHWPSLTTADSTGEVISLGQWISVPSTSLTAEIPPFAGVDSSLWGTVPKEIPSFNALRTRSNDVREFVSLWAQKIDGDPNHFRYAFRQNGKLKTMTDAKVELDAWNYMMLSLENTDPANPGEPHGMRLTLRTSIDTLLEDNSLIALQYDLRGNPDDVASYRSNLHSWLWNAAAVREKSCNDPFSTNFDATVSNGQRNICIPFEPAGCSDPFLNNVNYLPYASYDATFGVEECDYSYFGHGQTVTLLWATDASEYPHEIPQILRVTESGEEVVQQTFTGDLELFHDRLGAEDYSYTMIPLSLICQAETTASEWSTRKKPLERPQTLPAASPPSTNLERHF